MAIVVRKTKDGIPRFQVRVRDTNGKWFECPTLENQADAKTEEARLLQLRKKGMKANSNEAKKYTVNEFWEVWSEENRIEVSEGWKISQDQMYRDYVKPVIGDLKMIEVDAPWIGRIMKRSKELGRGDQTRKHIYSLCRKMFSDAVEYYCMLSDNPVKPKFHRPKVNEKAAKFLTPPQAWALLEAVKEHHFMGPPVWLQTLAALRTEATLALGWFQIRWDEDQILICRAWKEKTGKLEEFPKGDAWAYVPMPKPLKDYLWERWEQSGKDETDFVCKSIKGTMLPYETYMRALKRICRKSGLPVVTPHGLRHSSTELYIQEGASPEDVRRLLTQKSLSATKRYIHNTGTRLSGIAGRISGPGLRVIDGGEGNGVFPKSVPIGNKEAKCLPHGGESVVSK